MVVEEDSRYSAEYHEEDKRSIANAMQVFFKDGSHTDRIEVEYPIGHRRRREEGIPVLEAKFERNLKGHFPRAQSERIIAMVSDQATLEATSVNDFVEAMQI